MARMPTATALHSRRGGDRRNEMDGADFVIKTMHRRITCAEARKHCIAPVPHGHPSYRHMRDADGVVCE